MASTRHRSLVKRSGRKALLETLHTKNKYQKTDIHESKEKIRAHKASSEATRLLCFYKVIKASSNNEASE